MIYGKGAMTRKTTRVRVSRELADEVMRALGAKSRTEAARIAVTTILGWERHKRLAGRAAGESRVREAKAKK
jgi:Arc/MetJ family transcription regulator